MLANRLVPEVKKTQVQAGSVRLRGAVPGMGLLFPEVVQGSNRIDILERIIYL